MTARSLPGRHGALLKLESLVQVPDQRVAVHWSSMYRALSILMANVQRSLSGSPVQEAKKPVVVGELQIDAPVPRLKWIREEPILLDPHSRGARLEVPNGTPEWWWELCS